MWRLPAITAHGRWYRQIDAYVDGELSQAGEGRFERHLGGCERCAAALTEAQAVKTLLAALPEEPAPRSFALTEAMLAPVPLASAPAPSRGQGALRWGSSFAAAAAVFAFVALVVVDVGGGSGSQQLASPLSFQSQGGGDSDSVEASPEDASAETGDANGDQAAPADGEGLPEGAAGDGAGRVADDAEVETTSSGVDPGDGAAEGGPAAAEIAETQALPPEERGEGSEGLNSAADPPSDEGAIAESQAAESAGGAAATAPGKSVGQAEASADGALSADERIAPLLEDTSDPTFGALRVAQIVVAATAVIALAIAVALWRRAKGVPA